MCVLCDMKCCIYIEIYSKKVSYTSANLGFNDTSNQNIVSLKIKKRCVEIKCVVKNNKCGIFNDTFFASLFNFFDTNFVSLINNIICISLKSYPN